MGILRMNGKFRIGILALLGLVVVGGIVGASVSHDPQILAFCTMVCVSLLAILHQATASKLDDVAKETAKQTIAIADVKNQTDGLTKELVKKSEKIAFEVGKEVGAQAAKQEDAK